MKNLMFLLAFVLFSGVLTAQRADRQRPGQGEQRIEAMAAELGLTAEQQKRIELIEANAKTERKALRNESLSEEERRAKQRELGKQTRTSINEVLTEEQRAKLKSLRSDKRKKKGGKRPKLSPETREKVEAYKKENIKPTLQGARRELDQRISSADRQEIARLRTVMATKPNAKMHKSKGANKQAVTPAEREAKKAAYKEWKEAHAADFSSLQKLTEKYRGDMAVIMEQVTKEQQQWKADLNKITAADRANNVGDKPTHEGKKKGKGTQKAVGNSGKKGNKMSRFLLMDLGS